MEEATPGTDVKRRTLLRASVAAGALLSGCLEAGDDPGDSGSPDGGGTPTGTAGQSPAGTGGGEPGGDGADGDGGAATDGPIETGTTTDEDTPTGTDETTETTETSGSNAMVGRSFEVGGTECGQGVDRADVSRNDDRVDVDGTIRGRNGCYTAELEGATYDDGSDELTVAVRAYEDGDGGYCQQCIVDVDYRASFEFEDGTPDEVTVVHDGEHVTTE